ncbi:MULTISPECIES: flagellar basal-body MS-ring/collar protein FliF [unclassified Aliiroseovarius]|uniref:flagellar basal-body MS-ring/collar protein FliF n=1 Tax=unclassified Aliiroseovarius TaxID=2623558 RepID=UPI00156A240A|nr:MULTISPECIES: flagellar basal-body MS-ring/collar protein FliF [unclassified Aliiroseovarius]NRP13550.1 Flagellar M-ring protein [Aliiroseovarius sp. xm-d-517]NRP41310.1 Flagellar M-ring protein [Aliiroseovarius sp. xm-m-339-2]NRP62197.1 Flagellar M-ring protein [Aliiroseovarius sp. xm-a-151]
MQQIQTVWSALDMRKKVIVVLATLAMFAAVLGISRMASKPSMSLLYAGLEPGAAGEVIKALEAQSASFEVRNGAIYVNASQRDGLRMTLASEGLPSNSAKGYELLDGLSGFGTTSQMFDAAYWRAKEGELARTIVSSPFVQSARVHIAQSVQQGLRRRAKPTGSVTLSSTSGTISSAQAKAFKYLVSSAVPGMSPEDVSIIDSRGGLITAGDETETAQSSVGNRAEEMKANIQHLLEARVGLGNAVVELSLETATERESILEKTFDPNSRVAISTETQENSSQSSDSGNGSVTVASNLPDGEGSAGASSSAQNSETRERINYEVSETTREIIRNPGATKRITVAVLVDGLRSVNEAGETIWQPRSEEELNSLRDLVASAIGFDQSRGDTITIKTMEFEPVSEAGTEVTSSLMQGVEFDLMSIIQLAVLAVVALILGLFVIRPILANSKGALENTPSAGALPGPQLAGGQQPSPAAEAPSDMLAPAPIQFNTDFSDMPSLSGEIDDGEFPAPQMATVSDIDFDEDPLGRSDDPVKRLRNLIEERQSETLEILRGWMDEETV